jgi:hypothetical protein
MWRIKMFETFLQMAMLIGAGLMIGGLIGLSDRRKPALEYHPAKDIEDNIEKNTKIVKEHKKSLIDSCKHKEYTSSGVIYDDNHKIVQYLRLCKSCGEEYAYTPMCRTTTHKRKSNRSKE